MFPAVKLLREMRAAKTGDEEKEMFEWIRCPTLAVLDLSQLSIRHLKKACKGPKKEGPKTPKSASKKDDGHGAGGDSRVYALMADGSAVDLVWLASALPMHILHTLIAETVPKAAAGDGATVGGRGWRCEWFAYIAKCMHVLFCLVQLGVDYPSLISTLLQQHDPAGVVGCPGAANSPALVVDVLLFSHTLALAMRYDADEEVAADGDEASSSVDPATGTAPEEEEKTAGGAEQDSSVGGSQPIDVVGMVLRSIAMLMRIEHTDDVLVRPFRKHLVGHPKVTKALCEGIFDAMDECFSQMTRGAVIDQRRRELRTFVEAAMEALFFCCTDEGFVADLLVCSYMRHGRALSVLKKVLYVEHVECVSLMLRWLLLFCEYENPPSVDVLAGYDLYNGLLLSVMDRNNDAMVAWGVKSPLNPIALDLLKAVEIFADDSNFKQGVIDTSASAVATVLKRGPEYNGFNKSDKIHLPFTRAFFKLIAAMHCFNADVMPAEQEVLSDVFVRE